MMQNSPHQRLQRQPAVVLLGHLAVGARAVLRVDDVAVRERELLVPARDAHRPDAVANLHHVNSGLLVGRKQRGGGACERGVRGAGSRLEDVGARRRGCAGEGVVCAHVGVAAAEAAGRAEHGDRVTRHEAEALDDEDDLQGGGDRRFGERRRRVRSTCDFLCHRPPQQGFLTDIKVAQLALEQPPLCAARCGARRNAGRAAHRRALVEEGRREARRGAGRRGGGRAGVRRGLRDERRGARRADEGLAGARAVPGGAAGVGRERGPAGAVAEDDVAE